MNGRNSLNPRGDDFSRADFRRALGGVLLAAFVVSPAMAFAQPKGTPSEVFKKSSPALVTITTPDWFGSGVVLDGSGVIVTNLHVIRGSEKATIRRANGDTYEEVRVIQVDPAKDLALLKVNGSGLPAAILGNSDDLEIGQRVYAIGAPRGLELTISEGLVSGRRENEGHQVLQTSAAISSGSSGGGLFDEAGQLIAITTSKIDDGQNLNFAVPINYVRTMLGSPPRWTLAELNAHLAASGAKSDADASAPTALDTVPRLAQFYTNTKGDIAVVEQATASSVRVSFSTGGYVYGSAVLQWDSAKKGFVGKGIQKTPCGPLDRRLWDAPVEQEIVLLNDTLIRDRWTHPVKVDCRKGVVRSYSAQEVLWYVPSPQ